jgi:cell pole-organizing protein PopZ
MATKKEPTISEQQAQEIVERMSRRESRDRTSLNDFYKRIGLEPDVPEQTKAPDTSEVETAVTEEAVNEVLEKSASEMSGKAAVPQKRISSKQRRLSLDEYRATYLQVPKIADRKPVFVSGKVRDSLDRIVRYFGGRGMSASGMVENLVRLHLETYREDIEQWRKL